MGKKWPMTKRYYKWPIRFLAKSGPPMEKKWPTVDFLLGRSGPPVIFYGEEVAHRRIFLGKKWPMTKRYYKWPIRFLAKSGPPKEKKWPTVDFLLGRSGPPVIFYREEVAHGQKVL